MRRIQSSAWRELALVPLIAAALCAGTLAEAASDPSTLAPAGAAAGALMLGQVINAESGGSTEPADAGSRRSLGRSRAALARPRPYGRKFMPRITYQAPPFEGGDYWRIGGAFTADRPQRFLSPLRFQYRIEPQRDLSGAHVNFQIWGNSTLYMAADLTILGNPNGYGDLWRFSVDWGGLFWLTEKIHTQIGMYIGAERDVILASPVDNNVGFEFGFTTRWMLWRIELRADWIMRLDSGDVLHGGDLRHALRLQAQIEVVRFDNFGLEIGAFGDISQGAKSFWGITIGLRFWLGADRDVPREISNYRPLIR